MVQQAMQMVRKVQAPKLVRWLARIVAHGQRLFGEETVKAELHVMHVVSCSQIIPMAH